jgi:CRISPR-associated protein Cmr3
MHNQRKWIWRFRALDTLFFRDGTPFNMEETGVAPQGVFPPSIFTLQGAIRAAMAHFIKQWVPGKEWPKELGGEYIDTRRLSPEEKRKVWAQPDSLGNLRLSGPYLQMHGKRYDPVPLVLYGTRERLTRLSPTEKSDESDFLQVKFFLSPDRHLPDGKWIENWWIDREGMEVILEGGVPEPDSFLCPEDHWKPERRVGIKRGPNRTAEDHHLYAVTHTRPDRDLEVVVEVSGMEEKWHVPEKFMIPLGGEGRFAEVTVEEKDAEDDSGFPCIPEEKQFHQDGKGYFTVTLLTPGRYPDMKKAVNQGPPEIREHLSSAVCLSAGIGKAVQIGGWNVARTWPRTLMTFLPSGSTWFYQADPEELVKLKHLHGVTTGEYQEYGMGQIVIGTWKKRGEAK